MCGPLALGVLSSKNQQGFAALVSAILYNWGRTISYMVWGLIFGLVGSIVAFGGIQKIVSISLGLLMVFIFLFSINLDHLISKHRWFRNQYIKISHLLTSLTQKSKKVSSFNLGLINGILPCGLVYLAIAGALSLCNIWGSFGFMMFFGLGTFPAMLAVILSRQLITLNLRFSFRKIYPYISLIMGIYLIYRGSMSKFPLDLNFYEALKNPIMCH